MKIAIDGPAGAGKSTVSKAIAEKLGFIYVDTGALYRALAHTCLENNVDIQKSYDFVKNFKVEIKRIDNQQKVFVEDKDVTPFLRTADISSAASKISAIPEIRAFLLDLQRNIAENNNVVMDGRDIGTVILPDADIKIFLTANAEERANRRFAELAGKTNCPSYASVLDDINKRDYDDIHRDIAPLKQAEDAILLDTTKLSQEDVIEKLFLICNGKRLELSEKEI
jgi:cytidylate kinase